MRERPAGSGHWQLRVFVGVDPASGRPLQRSATFHGGERDAAKELARMVTDVESGKVDHTRITVGQLLDEWLTHISSTRRPTTLHEASRSIEKKIRPALGHIRLDKLGPADLDAWYTRWLADGLSGSSVRRLHAVLSAALNTAERWGWIAISPARRSRPPIARPTAIRVPTPDQLTKLIQSAEATDPVLATAIALAALTGARRGELVALRWSDVDLEGGSVQIERSISIVEGNVHEGPTKTHAARRVALDRFGVEVLRRHRTAAEALAGQAESPLIDDAYVLSPNANGARPTSPNTLTSRFAALCRKTESLARKDAAASGREQVGMDQWRFRFHDLRHFSVTTLIAAGVDVRTVAERHGHARATMTLDRYAHALPERDREAAGVLGRALGA